MATAPGNGGNGPPNQGPGGNANRPFNLLGLPAELRRMMFKYVLSPFQTSICNLVYPNILRVDQQVHDEARPILHGYWAPRIRVSNIVAAECGDWIEEGMTIASSQQLGHPSEHLHPDVPPCIVLTSDEINAWRGSQRGLPAPGEIAWSSDLGYNVLNETRDALERTYPSIQEIVVHLDITKSSPTVSVDGMLLFIRSLLIPWGRLRIKKVTLEIHAPGYAFEGRPYAEYWVQTFRAHLRQVYHPLGLLTFDELTVRQYKGEFQQ